MEYRIDIALLRRDLGLKQAEFAYELGIKQPYLSEIENGKKPVTDEIYERIRNKWGVNTCDKYAITSQASATGDNNTQIAGNSNQVNCSSSFDKALEEIAAQRRLVEKSQEQIDKLLVVIDRLTKR